jgi:hypothetical protein
MTSGTFFSSLLLLALACDSYAYFEHSADSADEMNGISFNEHKRFTEEWKLVTVRFREDSGEIRMTYANAIAYKAMSSLTPSYPVGSKFGKVSFTSRFQLMVKNPKIYGETNNWGYALFDANGRLFKEDVKEKTMACAACHQLVPERDFVFSRPYHFMAPAFLVGAKSRSDLIIFQSREPNYFKGVVREELKGSTARLESLEGQLKDKSFSGTLDEVVPLLLERNRLMRKDAILFVNEKSFTLVKTVKSRKEACSELKTHSSRVVIYFNGGKVRDTEICH